MVSGRFTGEPKCAVEKVLRSIIAVSELGSLICTYGQQRDLVTIINKSKKEGLGTGHNCKIV